MKEANEGEFTLIYNDNGNGYLVGLTKEQHDMLQLLLKGFGNIQVIKDIIVEYKKNDNDE